MCTARSSDHPRGVSTRHPPSPGAGTPTPRDQTPPEQAPPQPPWTRPPQDQTPPGAGTPLTPLLTESQTPVKI